MEKSRAHEASPNCDEGFYELADLGCLANSPGGSAFVEFRGSRSTPEPFDEQGGKTYD